jgi:uncharacterized protein YutE (UPF0331/DUF86 family)
MPDKARLAAQLDELGRAIDDLERYGRTWSFDEWVTDGDRRRMVLNAAYTAAQACIDIAARLVAAMGKDRPEAYRELFAPLAEAGVIDRETAAQLARWAGLRDVVAHLYWKLHLEEIDGALRGDLEPLRAFRAAAARLVNPRRPSGADEAREKGPRYRKTGKPAGATSPRGHSRGTTTTTTTTTTTRGKAKR